MPTWHRETEALSKSFLQFDIEHGAKSDLGKDASREGDDGDQALGSVQGSARQTKRKDYSKLEALESQKTSRTERVWLTAKKINMHFQFIKNRKMATSEEEHSYKQQAKTIESYQKRLKQMIQKRLSIKNIAENRPSCWETEQ